MQNYTQKNPKVDDKREVEKKRTYFEDYKHIISIEDIKERYLELQKDDRMRLYGARSDPQLLIVAADDSLGEEDLRHFLKHSDPFAICLNPTLLHILSKVIKDAPTIEYVLYNTEPEVKQADIDKLKEANSGLEIISLDELVKRSKKNPLDPIPLSSDGLICVVYASASAGLPKDEAIKHNVCTIKTKLNPSFGYGKTAIRAYVDDQPLPTSIEPNAGKRSELPASLANWMRRMSANLNPMAVTAVIFGHHITPTQAAPVSYVGEGHTGSVGEYACVAGILFLVFLNNVLTRTAPQGVAILRASRFSIALTLGTPVVTARSVPLSIRAVAFFAILLSQYYHFKAHFRHYNLIQKYKIAFAITVTAFKVDYFICRCVFTVLGSTTNGFDLKTAYLFLAISLWLSTKVLAGLCSVLTAPPPPPPPPPPYH